MKKGVTVDAGRARDARVHRRRHHGARLSHVRLPDGDRAGDHRLARARAPAVRRRAACSRRSGTASPRPRTARSAQTPELFGIRLHARAGGDASRATTSPFDDPTGCDHDALGAGLRKALYNYMHGLGLDADVRDWFEPPPAGRSPRKRGSRGRQFLPTSSALPCVSAFRVRFGSAVRSGTRSPSRRRAV